MAAGEAAAPRLQSERFAPLVLAPYALLAVVAVVHGVISTISLPGRGPAYELWAAPVVEVVAGLLALAAARYSYARRAPTTQGPGYGLSISGPATQGPGYGLATSGPAIQGPGYDLGAAAPAWAIGSAVLLAATGDGLDATRGSGWLHVTAWAPAVFHLAVYPAAAVGLILFLHGRLRGSTLSDALDGLIAGLGTAAACTAFTFQDFPARLSGNAPGTVTQLGLLVGNTLLAALATGCLASISGRRNLAAVILGAGVLLNIVARTSQLFQGFAGPSRLGQVLVSTAMPLGLTFMSASVWLRPGGAAQGSRERPTEFMLPNIAAAGALVVGFANAFTPINRAALLLSSLTLLAAGIRLFLLLRDTRAISEFRHEQAATDELTGLWNRRHLFRVLDGYFAKRATGADDTPLAFLFVDLNRFKEINDSFGHPAGDQLLKLLAARLAGSLRDSDILVRLGGDEFAVILPGSDNEGATTVALRLSSCLEHPFQLDRVRASIGASIGIALAPQDATDSENLLWCADVAMYRAKMENSRLEFYEQTVDVERDQMRLLEELRTAMAEDELLLHYQPQLDLRNGAIAGVEALLRWNHPRLGMLAPVNFLPLAERTGEIGAVTRWVLEHAATQLSVWRSKGLELTVSVNISPSNLLEADLVAMVTETLNRHALPASALVLEMTENWVAADFETARDVVRALGALGVTVSIDDFGAGTTSIAYLRELAAGELKLDRAFVTNLTAESNQKEPELLRSTIDLGHAMGLRIVAEGVEDEETLDLLSSLGCDLAQGYYISKPKPPNELALRPKVGRRAA